MFVTVEDIHEEARAPIVGTLFETDGFIADTRFRLDMERGDAFIKSTTAFKSSHEHVKCPLWNVTDNWTQGIEEKLTNQFEDLRGTGLIEDLDESKMDGFFQSKKRCRSAEEYRPRTLSLIVYQLSWTNLKFGIIQRRWNIHC